MAKNEPKTIEEQVAELTSTLNAQSAQTDKMAKEIAALSKENASLQDNLGEQSAKAEALQTQFDGLHEVSVNQANQIVELTTQCAGLREENAELKKAVAAKADPAEAAKPKPVPVIPTEPFEVGGELYKFVSAKFTLPARKGGRTEAISLTAVDALADTAILAELVAIGSGVIAKVVTD